jgi:hypothetical protein
MSTKLQLTDSYRMGNPMPPPFSYDAIQVYIRQTIGKMQFSNHRPTLLAKLNNQVCVSVGLLDVM